jgi:ubiquinone biosynthesis protein
VPTEHAQDATSNGFVIYQERRPAGLITRFFITLGQLLGLLFGALNDFLQQPAASHQTSLLLVVPLRVVLFFVRPFLDRQIIQKPFPVQFRLRLERLGPTYIKLGQILSLREDVLPKALTSELVNLLDRLPVVAFDRYREIVQTDLERPLETIFAWLDPIPLGSASLGQTHRARLHTGERVVLKVLKPGVRQTVETDTKLLRLVGRVLQIFFARYQPARLIDEFCRYTLREVDLRFEADNAEAFAGNFKDQPDIHFPKIYREFSSHNVLCMQYFQGIKPDARAAAILTPQEKEKILQLMAKATIRMIFRDGFFHADLHPGNLLIFKDASVGFLDLGMVGRFDREVQQRLFYYFYSLVSGDTDNAARYLASITTVGKNSDVDGFRRAVAGLYDRWLRSANFNDFSLAQVMLQSILLAGQYRIEYPSEIILMVKSLVTLEGAGNLLQPGIDIVELSRKDVRRLLIDQFNLVTFVKASLLVVPELAVILNRSPLILSEGLKQIEGNLRNHTSSRIRALRPTILAASSILAVAILFASGAPWPLWGGLFLMALYWILRG